jgi:hypothetical protein
MSNVFQNIDPHPAYGTGEDTLAGWRGGARGSIVRKTPDTALYSIHVQQRGNYPHIIFSYKLYSTVNRNFRNMRFLF